MLCEEHSCPVTLIQMPDPLLPFIYQLVTELSGSKYWWKKMFACSGMYLAEASPVWYDPPYFQGEFKNKTKKSQISHNFLTCLCTAKLTCQIKYNMQVSSEVMLLKRNCQMQNQ